MNASHESTTSASVHLDLSDDERELLRDGLLEWGGSAHLTDPMAVAMGFASSADFFSTAKKLRLLLEEKAALPPAEWRRILLATEIVFVSDVVGAGYEWETVTGMDDESTLRVLRGLQKRLPMLFARGRTTPAPDPLEEAAWHRAAGDLRGEDLPELATDALVRGLDSPALRILAGQNPSDTDVSRELFAEVLTELSIPVLGTDEALWRLVRLTAEQIVNGQTAPNEGARWIALHAALEVAEEGDLRVFRELVYEIDDFPDADTSWIEREIVSVCIEMLDRPVPRRWIQLRAASGRTPLTRQSLQGQVDVPIVELGIEAQLADDVSSWAQFYDVTLGQWPDSGGFTSTKQAEKFVERGRLLATRLQDGLGPTHHVEYAQEPSDLPGVKLAHRRWLRRRS